ncbi:MAG TPA: hypothetical protein VG013_06420 [Gemmataceae bacterium]|jgi:hypothetical protein|nr:hypothetical protein [Gemmataceae bacterium]
MASQTRAARLADEFVASYPESLPRRLGWLSENLRIDRPRFLRQIGLAPDEVEKNLDTPWEVIAKQWEDQAWWVEELLCQLIALFSYDWRTLANRLHQLAADANRPQPEYVSRPSGHVARLHTLPPADREKTLITLIAQGGPDALTWLIEYLTQPANGGKLTENHHQA